MAASEVQLTPSPGDVAAPIEVFWDPASVAVVGASDDPAKWGHWLARGALAGRHRREVHLVNRRGSQVCGTRTVRSIDGLGSAPDLAVLAVPAAAVEAAVDDAIAAGARGLLVISDGLDRVADRPGLATELGQRARARGVRMIGPSSLGLVACDRDLQLSWGTFTSGPVSVVTQSGQVGSELAYMLARHGSGISRFVSVGAQTDVTTEDLLDTMADHERTRAVVAYVEDIRRPEAFLSAAERLREAGIPLIVLAVGSSDAGSAAARSHTGALTGSMDVLDAACRSVGAVRASTPAQAAAAAHALSLGVRPLGTRIFVISDSGGQGALAADVAADLGLEVPPPTQGLTAELGRALGASRTPGNPTDLAGAGEQDLATYAVLAERAAASGEFDAVVVSGYFGRYAEDTPSLTALEGRVAERLGRVASSTPVLVHSITDESPTAQALCGAGVPVFSDVETTLGSLHSCARWTGGHTRSIGVRLPRPDGSVTELPYLEARSRLEAVGVAFPPAGTATSSAQAVEVARRWDGPSVAKAVGVAHKTEVRGVVLGLEGDAAVAAAYDDLDTRLGSSTVVIEQMDRRQGVIELIVGVKHDPTFGPVVLVGSGGVTAELWRDTAVELAPVTESDAEAMVRRLRIWPLLTGWRGAPAVDIPGLCRTIAALSTLLDTDPSVVSGEINPVRAGSEAVVAVDALVCVAQGPKPTDLKENL